MFGLGKEDKKEELLLELEEKILHDAGRRELKNKISERMQKIRNGLREGSSSKAELEKLGMILNGYASLLKVIARPRKR